MIKLNHLSSRYTLTDRETPSNKEALAEIRNILEGIKTGALLHNQKYYHSLTHCGTAHCVAGWKAYLDSVKAGIEITFEGAIDNPTYSPALEEFTVQANGCAAPWGYATREWNLILMEENILFRIDATLEEQFELLEVLEAGFTVSLKE